MWVKGWDTLTDNQQLIARDMWTPIDARFFIKRRPVAIASVSASEGELVRDVLEHFNAVVRLYGPGTPGDFLAVLKERLVAGALVQLAEEQGGLDAVAARVAARDADPYGIAEALAARLRGR